MIQVFGQDFTEIYFVQVEDVPYLNPFVRCVLIVRFVFVECAMLRINLPLDTRQIMNFGSVKFFLNLVINQAEISSLACCRLFIYSILFNQAMNFAFTLLL